MDIKKINIKQKLLMGSAVAVLSSFVPPVMDQAQAAGTASMPISIELIAAIALSNTNALDFGRLAITGAPAGNNHVITPGGTTTPAGGVTVVTAGVPGNFEITGGISAGDVQISFPAAVAYDGGNIQLDRLIFGGAGLTGTVTVDAAGTGGGVFSGGADTVIDVGGRISFSGTPTLGAYTGQNASIIINDIP